MSASSVSTEPSTHPDHIWYSHCGYSPLAMAIQLGWIADAVSQDGITLRSVKRDGSADDQLSHYDHHLPFSIRQGGNVPALWARSIGSETRLLGVNWLDEYQAIIVLPATGIVSASDLKDRRIALPSANHPVDHVRASNLRGISTALELAGLSVERDVELVRLDQQLKSFGGPGAEEGAKKDSRPSLAEQALLEGRVDAIFVRGPQGLALTERLGATIISELSEHPDPLVRANNGSPRPLTVDAAFLDARPDLVFRLIKKVADVGRWAETNAGTAAALIARQGGVSQDIVHRAYRGNLHRRLHTTLDDTAIDGFAAYKDFLVAQGFLPNDFDMSSWIAPEPLAAALSPALRAIA